VWRYSVKFLFGFNKETNEITHFLSLKDKDGLEVLIVARVLNAQSKINGTVNVCQAQAQMVYLYIHSVEVKRGLEGE
jgi:hypothetical protein